MVEDTASIQALSKRVELLERQNRRLKAAAVAVLAAVAALVLMGQASPGPNVIKAQGLLLKDASGRVRAALSMGGNAGDAPGLRLLDASGTPVASIAESSIGPALLLSNGGNSLMLSALRDRFGLDLRSGGGERASLQVHNDNPGLSFDDASGHSSVELTAGPSVSGLLMSNGKQSTLVSATAGGPFISLADANGFSTDIGGTDLVTPTTGETHHTSAASIVMFGSGKEHRVIWQAPEN